MYWAEVIPVCSIYPLTSWNPIFIIILKKSNLKSVDELKRSDLGLLIFSSFVISFS
jgi:hypothetical protein